MAIFTVISSHLEPQSSALIYDLKYAQSGKDTDFLGDVVSNTGLTTLWQSLFLDMQQLS